MQRIRREKQVMSFKHLNPKYRYVHFSFNSFIFHLAYICYMAAFKKEKSITQPLPLKPGDLIGITCPAGYMPKEKINDCVRGLRQWGYEVIVGQIGRAHV